MKNQTNTIRAAVDKEAEIVHLGVRKNFSGYESACGDNSAMIKSQGKLIKTHGAALRTTDKNKVTCASCMKMKENV